MRALLSLSPSLSPLTGERVNLSQSPQSIYAGRREDGHKGAAALLPDPGPLQEGLPPCYGVPGARGVPRGHPEVLQLQRDAQGLRPRHAPALRGLCGRAGASRTWGVRPSRWALRSCVGLCLHWPGIYFSTFSSVFTRFHFSPVRSFLIMLY